MLPSEKRKLEEKAKKMADRYSWIVFMNRSIGTMDDKNTNSFMEFKSRILSNQKNDRYFYETMMIFSAKVL